MFYAFSRATPNTQPYVYVSRDLLPPANPAADIVLLLPDLFRQAPGGDLARGPFTLTAHAPGADGSFFPYKIVIPKGSVVWQFDNTPIRAFREDYIDFLIALEGLLKPGALAFVQQLLAQNLPLTFAETLYYSYGCDPANSYVDVRPGMRLCLEAQVHQFIAPAAPGFVNGFVAGGGAYYYPAAYADAAGALQLGLNPFLALLQGTTVAPNRGGAGGSVDLAGAANARPYYRLFYPRTFVSSDSAGFSGSQQNVTLVGANSLADLRTATAQYLAAGNCDNLPVTSTFFRGRAILTPEILVLVNNTPVYVALGTTIRQLLAGFGPIPRLDHLLVDAKSGLAYYRQLITLSAPNKNGPAVMRYPLAAQVFIPSGALDAVAAGYALYSAVQDSFDLPVLGGDSVTVTFPDRQP